MKIRRRTQSFRVAKLFSWFRPGDWFAAVRQRLAPNRRDDAWLDRVDQPAASADPGPAAPTPFELASPTPAVVPAEPLDAGASWTQRVKHSIRQRPLLWASTGSFGLTLAVGYGISAFILFPAPFFTANQTVPELLGMTQDAAEARLAEDGLPAPILDFENHPFSETGTIIWQDPPPGVVVPEITAIELVVSNGPQRIAVPDLGGFEMGLARRLLEASGLTVGRIEEVQTSVPRNVTVNTRPAPGSTLLPGAPVTLVVSIGAPNVGIPNLTGLTREEARDTLEAVGLALGNVERRTSSAQLPGLVIDQQPGAGTLAATGTSVTIILAKETAVSKGLRIAPSILSADWLTLREQVEQVVEAGADWIHIDVMDGRFVPNLTFGAEMIRTIRRITDLPLDVHLMVVEPENYITAFSEAGASLFTFHPEATTHVQRQLDAIKAAGMQAGLALNPGTPMSWAEEVVDDLDLLLIMSVNPGYGGQSFLPSALDKIERARQLLDDRGSGAYLEVDGGVSPETVASVCRAGADTLVAGSAVFNADDPAAAVRTLRTLGEKGKAE